jgi:hypothetical protein
MTGRTRRLGRAGPCRTRFTETWTSCSVSSVTVPPVLVPRGPELIALEPTDQG